ncbi:MAG: hypothetical protein F6K62_18035 [Sphaerospermopsis sp. SIO1G2]|nr:hypothetical protein [Sphaerospermopsis sp. SIO1G2]
MDRGENSKSDCEITSKIIITNHQLNHQNLRINVLDALPWRQPPFSYLTPEAQTELKDKLEVCKYQLGEKIWSEETGEYQFFIITGKVRLRDQNSQPFVTLQDGEWFGSLQPLFTQCKAIAASKEVIVVCWQSSIWTQFHNLKIDKFWHNEADSEQKIDAGNIEQQTADFYRPKSPFSASPSPPQNVVSEYPFIISVNTAAACLTMVAQYLNNGVQLEWVQRQLRGQKPKNIIETAEKLGLSLRKLQVNWKELRQLSFPALLQWNSEGIKNWVVAYGMKGNCLIIANPLNTECEYLTQSVVESSWDFQLWQAELISQQEKFNLSWFTPAVWKYRKLLGEVLLASFTLQLLGLTSPLITQVIIDKVMVQESLATLDVMAIALLLVAIFESHWWGPKWDFRESQWDFLWWVLHW